MSQLPQADGPIREEDTRVLERLLDQTLAAFPGELLHIVEVGMGPGDTARRIKAWLDARARPFVYWGVDSGAHSSPALPFPGANMVAGDASEVWPEVPGGMHWAFIDGCHCINHTVLNFLNYGPKVLPGGLLLFHNTTPHAHFRNYQGHGPRVAEFHVASRSGLERIGLLGGKWPEWEVVEDSWPEGAELGGVCAFRRVDSVGLEPADQRLYASEAVLPLDVAGEAVLFDSESEHFFSVNTLGSQIWKGLAAGRTVDELVAETLDEYDVDETSLKRGVEEFMGQLLACGLLSRSRPRDE
jgi:hypothetical protein